tara:strand:+ start:169 stop:378 length:210 start_codon:yes stop_codon:yes gene_type:complete
LKTLSSPTLLLFAFIGKKARSGQLNEPMLVSTYVFKSPFFMQVKYTSNCPNFNQGSGLLEKVKFAFFFI